MESSSRPSADSPAPCASKAGRGCPCRAAAGIAAPALSAAAAVCALWLAFPGQAGRTRFFWGLDTVSAPSRLVRVEARIYARDSAGKRFAGAPGIPVTISMAGIPFQRSVTDHDGSAMFFVESPALPGSYAYGLEARGGSWSGHAQAMVHVFPGPARLAIIDSDTLLFGRNPGPAVAAGLALASPAEGAAEAVRKIASACGIVYLSGMHETSTQGLRAWLLRGGFPPGAILPRDDTLADLGVFEFKRRRIEEIKLFWRSDWVGLCAGRVEAEAFFACGVRAFAVGLPAGSEPRGILRAATLAEAAGLIAK